MHTVLDLLTLAATAWVIYTLRVTLKDSYQNEQDTIQTYYVVRTPTAQRACYMVLYERQHSKMLAGHYSIAGDHLC